MSELCIRHGASKILLLINPGPSSNLELEASGMLIVLVTVGFVTDLALRATLHSPKRRAVGLKDSLPRTYWLVLHGVQSTPQSCRGIGRSRTPGLGSSSILAIQPRNTTPFTKNLTTHHDHSPRPIKQAMCKRFLPRGRSGLMPNVF